MKKLINDVSEVVPDMLDGLAALNPGLSLLQGSTIIVRADAVLDAIRAVAGPAGVLLIVKNCTGDCFNFGLAAEIARAEGIAVEMMIVAAVVALSAHGDHAGRRGLAGTVFVHKIAGAAAAEGRSLGEVAQIARDTAASLGTMGVLAITHIFGEFEIEQDICKPYQSS
ncbi:MAG: Phosphoenolpyruvate-dihydroxyacetone phosphotransferase (EC, dihydroxyacetone binding subunit DhaK, partial [Candidatus Burkholderia crenata]